MSDTPINDELASLLNDFRDQLAQVGDEAGLYDLQVRFLGKKGSISLLRRGMGKLEPEVVSELLKGCANACRDNNLALLGGETAEMPGLVEPGMIELSGFCIGAAEK